MTQTIVKYTTQKVPTNAFPRRIISPPQSSDCCFSDMEPIGRSRRDGQWVFQYQRCRTCGFTVRAILRYVPDGTVLRGLRKSLAQPRLQDPAG